MDDTPIRVCATADTLTLYWDKPAGAPADCRYEVCAGGRIPVTVAHTHCTLTGLAPATEYTLEVWLEGRSLGTCRASTEPRLPRLDARDITVRDCRAPRVLIHAVPYNNDGTPAPQPPKFSDFTFTGVTLTGRALVQGAWQEVCPVEVEGFEAPGGEVCGVHCYGCTLAENRCELRPRRCCEVSFATAPDREED